MPQDAGDMPGLLLDLTGSLCCARSLAMCGSFAMKKAPSHYCGPRDAFKDTSNIVTLAKLLPKTSITSLKCAA